jgi:hypothetical protein
MWIRIEDFRQELIATYGASTKILLCVPPAEDAVYLDFADHEDLLRLIEWLDDVGATYSILQGKPPGP